MPSQIADLPLISLSALLHESSTKVDTAKALLTAFERDGFLYLSDYGEVIPQTLVSAVFHQSAKFFARPAAEKDALEWSGPRANRGFTCQGREKTSQAATKEAVTDERATEGQDLKESFEIGRENEDGCPNLWPEDQSAETLAFKATMQDMFQRCKDLHKVLMRGIALALGLAEAYFDDYVRVGDNTLRLLHYPAVSSDKFERGRQAMERFKHSEAFCFDFHSSGTMRDFADDFFTLSGSLTLLFQDEQGGLQVERPDQEGWFNVIPREKTIVVNAGDLLARWSNDTIRSTMHRVVEPLATSNRASHPPRYSVAYFCNPDFDRQIETIPGTGNGERKYEGVNSGEYLVQRLSLTY